MDDPKLACFALLLSIPAVADAAERRALIVVADSRDLEVTQRIGGNVVEVEAILPTPIEDAAEDYRYCNAQAMRLRHFGLYLFRTDSSCPREGFWRERLAASNGRGRVHQIGNRRQAATDPHGLRVQQATQVHLALVSALPEHKASFDENLMSELRRINALRTHSAALAFSQPTNP